MLASFNILCYLAIEIAFERSRNGGRASRHRSATRRHSGRLCIIPSHIYTSVRGRVGWEVREDAVAYRLEIVAKSLPGVQHAHTREVPGLTNGCSRWNCSSPEPASRKGKFSTVVARLHPLEILRADCSPCRFIIAAFVLSCFWQERTNSERKSVRGAYTCTITPSVKTLSVMIVRLN